MFERFEQRYDLAHSALLREIQHAACGCDYSATSWTTDAEADRMLELLDLAPHKRLLEVGTGAGWPGLYLAHRSRCEAALIDVPISGLRALRRRARADALAGTAWAVAGDGTALPFTDDCFDALVHSDVLCCLPAKREVLRSCRRVLRGDGVMVFSVISIADGLDADAARRAAAAGPPFVQSAAPYRELLTQSGWAVCAQIDLTPQYESSLRAIADLETQRRGPLIALLGEQRVTETCERRTAGLAALAEGLIRRELFHARPA